MKRRDFLEAIAAVFGTFGLAIHQREDGLIYEFHTSYADMQVETVRLEEQEEEDKEVEALREWSERFVKDGFDEYLDTRSL